jgi:DMSO/TMAO reductase YedYZ molybdopterin-dependent catalytic subunit
MILTTEGLLKMKQITLVAKGHDEKMHKYEGVLLLDVLSSAGVKFGEKAKKTTSASYVLVKGADNYRVIFSLAEIDTLFTDKKIMIASMEDNSPLPSNVGPFQIVAPGEKKHSRWVRQVVSIKVVTVY